MMGVGDDGIPDRDFQIQPKTLRFSLGENGLNPGAKVMSTKQGNVLQPKVSANSNRLGNVNKAEIFKVSNEK